MHSRNYIDVLGVIWLPAVKAVTTYNLSSYDVRNIAELAELNDTDGIDREAVEQWLAMHSGDFQEVLDFAAHIDGFDIPWADEESEWTFNDCMYPADVEAE